jgi:hypothetical protein
MRRLNLAFCILLAFLVICIFPVSAVVIPGMALSASPDPVVPGNLLTYTLTASNSGDETSSPTIFFRYDANLDYLSGSPVSNQEFLGDPVTNPPGAFWRTTVDPDPERIIAIDPGDSYIITVVTRVKAEVPCGTPITSTATMNDPGDGGGPTSATATVTTATTCGVPAPEFPSPVIPLTTVGLIILGILIVTSRAK